ncbi:MAG: hypothetical protein JW719_02600, partial [Pirellulales bacterium]|nr:hypothetical protein [Pirellulales bacterium]
MARFTLQCKVEHFYHENTKKRKREKEEVIGKLSIFRPFVLSWFRDKKRLGDKYSATTGVFWGCDCWLPTPSAVV